VHGFSPEHLWRVFTSYDPDALHVSDGIQHCRTAPISLSL
jgi:hypothetical protein